MGYKTVQSVPCVLHAVNPESSYLCFEGLAEAFLDDGESSTLSEKPCLNSLASRSPGLLGKDQDPTVLDPSVLSGEIL
jgi:hypothetical protein